MATFLIAWHYKEFSTSGGLNARVWGTVEAEPVPATWFR
jgi:hypothetical protein